MKIRNIIVAYLIHFVAYGYIWTFVRLYALKEIYIAKSLNQDLLISLLTALVSTIGLYFIVRMAKKKNGNVNFRKEMKKKPKAFKNFLFFLLFASLIAFYGYILVLLKVYFLQGNYTAQNLNLDLLISLLLAFCSTIGIYFGLKKRCNKTC